MSVQPEDKKKYNAADDVAAIQKDIVEFEDVKELNDDGNEYIAARKGLDKKGRVILYELYDDDLHLDTVRTEIHFYNEDGNWEKTRIYDEKGDLVGLKVSPERIFRKRWEDQYEGEVVKIPFYTRRHIQRISLTISAFLGDQGQDWDSFSYGFQEAVDMLEHNEDVNNEIVPQQILIGMKVNRFNDIEQFRKEIKKLALKYFTAKK